MLDIETSARRAEWFTKARFGMFIHWGVYAIPARGEWVRSHERITVNDYQKYFDAFNPSDYNPAEWARLAKQAGMKYAVLTSKHHDGFCLFDSKYTNYKSTKTASGRDFVREFVEAFRAEGLKVGLYYSLLDWHHPDYPHYGDNYHPMRDNPIYRHHSIDFNKYLLYMHSQVRELMTDYGKIDIIWFDNSYINKKGPMLWGEGWRATELTRMIRDLQPGILINNRLDGNDIIMGTLLTGRPNDCAGDFVCLEKNIPPEGMISIFGHRVPWESCITHNNNWGYAAQDNGYKPTKVIARTLVECVSKGGNLLLNVGPDANGRIPEASVKMLDEMGEWMTCNGHSIYGCGYADLPKPSFGYYTRQDGKVYAHVLGAATASITLTGIPGDIIASARSLTTGERLDIEHDNAEEAAEAIVKLGEDYKRQDERDDVIELIIKPRR